MPAQIYLFKFRQHGAALVIGLMLMTILTMLALATMRSATLQLTIAGNLQAYEQAMQLAEAGIADTLQRISADPNLLQTTSDWSRTIGDAVTTIGPGPSPGHYDVIIRFIGSGRPPGEDGTTHSAAHFYEIESTGYNASRNAQMTVHQGLFINQLNEINKTYWYPATTAHESHAN